MTNIWHVSHSLQVFKFQELYSKLTHFLMTRSSTARVWLYCSKVMELRNYPWAKMILSFKTQSFNNWFDSVFNCHIRRDFQSEDYLELVLLFANLTLDEVMPYIRKRQSDTPRPKRQQRSRRKNSIFKKAYEYSLKCDAQVYVMLRNKENGKLSIFNSEPNGHWPLSTEQLVRPSFGGKCNRKLFLTKFHSQHIIRFRSTWTYEILQWDSLKIETIFHQIMPLF